jgi:hypothetical protein
MYGFAPLSFRNKVEDSVGADKEGIEGVPVDGESDYEESLRSLDLETPGPVQDS